MHEHKTNCSWGNTACQRPPKHIFTHEQETGPRLQNEEWEVIIGKFLSD